MIKHVVFFADDGSYEVRRVHEDGSDFVAITDTHDAALKLMRRLDDGMTREQALADMLGVTLTEGE